MNSRFTWLFIVVFLFLSIFGACDDFEEDDTEKTKETSDDDNGFGDFGDDDSGFHDDDDLTDDDSAGDDDTPNPHDTEYELSACELPDPESIGEGILFGGGQQDGSMLVYVFDDQDCTPVSNAKVVIEGDVTVYLTDSDGMVTLPVSSGAHMVTAFSTGYWSWAYKVDTAVLYFRLKPADYGNIYVDSDPGAFKNSSGGGAITLSNPDSLQAMATGTTYMGLAVPGVSRNSILYSDFDGFMAVHTFNLDFVLGYYGAISIPLPCNYYFPYLDVMVNIPALGPTGFLIDNDEFVVPYLQTDQKTTLSGMILALDGGTILNPATVTDILIQALITYNLEGAISAAVEPLLSEGLSFPFVGMEVQGDPGADPNITVSPTDDGMTNIHFTSTSASDDYFGFLAAEIPNRAMVPLGIRQETNGSVKLPYANLDDADYIAVGAKTDWFGSVLTSSSASFVLRYSETAPSSVYIDDSEFLPYFDEGFWSYTNSTGRLTWALEDESNTDIDWFWLIYYPHEYYNPEPRVLMAILPPDTREFTVPTGFGIYPAYGDKFFLVGVDMPDEHEDGFDPTRLVGYNNTKYSLISYPTFLDNILDWFSGI